MFAKWHLYLTLPLVFWHLNLAGGQKILGFPTSFSFGKHAFSKVKSGFSMLKNAIFSPAAGWVENKWTRLLKYLHEGEGGSTKLFGCPLFFYHFFCINLVPLESGGQCRHFAPLPIKIHQGSSENGPSKECTQNAKIWKKCPIRWIFVYQSREATHVHVLVRYRYRYRYRY